MTWRQKFNQGSPPTLNMNYRTLSLTLVLSSYIFQKNRAMVTTDTVLTKMISSVSVLTMRRKSTVTPAWLRIYGPEFQHTNPPLQHTHCDPPNSQEMTNRRNGRVKAFLLPKHESMGHRDKSYSIKNVSHLSQRLKGEDFLPDSGFPRSQMKKDEKMVLWLLCSERFHWSPHKWTGKNWAVSAFSCIWWRNKRLAFSVLVIQKNSDIIEGNYNRINNTSKTFFKKPLPLFPWNKWHWLARLFNLK